MSMNYFDQIQDVVDAIEREAFIKVPKGYGVQIYEDWFEITFGEVLDEDELRLVEEIAYDYATSARSITTNEGSMLFTSSMTIRF